jgi:hypothetical protein
MATRILEFGGSGILGPAYPVVPAGQFVTKQPAMTATGTSARSAAVSAATALVLVQSDEQIYVEIDPLNAATPTATTDSYRIAAGGEQYFSINPSMAGIAKVAIRT